MMSPAHGSGYGSISASSSRRHHHHHHHHHRSAPHQKQHRQAAASSVTWTVILFLAVGAARLLAWPPQTGPDSWLFNFLRVSCPNEEFLEDLKKRDAGCENILVDFETLSRPKAEDDDVNSESESGFMIDPSSPDGLQERPYPGFVPCKLSPVEWKHYIKGFKPGGMCPDDWLSVQSLIFAKDCFQLPPRDCFVPFPPNLEEPLPRSKALWADPSLNNIVWHHYACDSFDCLRKRIAGDCRECFNWSAETTRWDWIEQRNLVLSEVLALKKGTLRLGLDVAGGSGSFAALLAAHNITVVTTGMNTGAPFLETMALRGLPALHIPMKARLPFFDRTFDIIHSQHAVQMLNLEDFEFMIYDWDRVLRPGGLIWLDRFYHPVSTMSKYIDIVALLNYKRHSWKQWNKAGKVVKFTAVLEKPLHP